MAQFNIRDLPERTAQQIDELCKQTGYTKTQLVIVAIDKLYQQTDKVRQFHEWLHSGKKK